MKLPFPTYIETSPDGPRFWKSLDEWSQSPEFRPWLEREFPEHASEWDDGLSRRRFVQLMGASMALAGLSGCSRQPQEKLVPYVRRPEEIIPGEPIYYATTFPHRGYGKGVVVRTEMGRPIKIEGNPDHPASRGAADVFMQASVLGLYDPDRSQTIRRGTEIATWDEFKQFASERIIAHERDQGEELYLLLGRTTSPSFHDQLERLARRFPKLSWCEYEPAAPVRTKSLSGRDAEPVYDLSRADLIVSLDADFLGQGAGNLMNARGFAEKRRDPAKSFSRIYVAESTPSITGAKADRRWRMKPSEIVAMAQALVNGGGSPEIAALRAELESHRGTSVVIAGDYQPEIVHALAYQLNESLGNIGTTVRYIDAPMPAVPARGLADFIAAMNQGAAKTLLIWGSNPIYDLPPDLRFAEALARVPHAVHLGLYDDETGSACEWHLPESHYLEAWGDALALDGTPSLIQPLIEPLYPSARSLLEVASLFVDFPPRTGYDIVRDFWSARMAPGDARAWERSLNKGVVMGAPGFPAPVPVAGIKPVAAPSASAASDMEILFRPDAAVDDGRFANNGWLQELPRPLTKLTWDNVAMISPKDAKLLGLKTGDLATLTVDQRSMEVPIWVQPGHADACILVTLGYGRWRAGEVANGVGFDANALRSSTQPWALTGARMESLGRWKILATTQDHFTMEGRGFIQVETLDEYRADPAKAAENKSAPPPADDFYAPVEYKGHAWGMSIDLNACIGCNACIVACQAENNIPVVGRDQVFRGREMHWIRVDRYFEGDPEEPAIHFQPVTCMQCEQAPCEVVCPVAATVHSSEGLNDMVYNRCVGTRYCSNNCPYKVRRFNFFQYSNERSPVLALQKNPDVTVRSRGVMEKCTYCVQRIEAARIDAQKEMRPIRDGEIVTACQATCPTEAIVFGDINDPKSRVSRLKAQPRNYAVLAELNTHPRTTYLSKVIDPPA